MTDIKFLYFQTPAQMVEYLCLSHQVNMVELKKKCMDWLSDHWDTMKKEREINDMWDTREGKQILSELLEYSMSKKM